MNGTSVEETRPNVCHISIVSKATSYGGMDRVSTLYGANILDGRVLGAASPKLNF